MGKKKKKATNVSKIKEFVRKNMTKVSAIKMDPIPLTLTKGEKHGYVLGGISFQGKEYAAILNLNTFKTHFMRDIKDNIRKPTEFEAIDEDEIFYLAAAACEERNILSDLRVMEMICREIIDTAAKQSMIEWATLSEAIELAKNDLISPLDLQVILFSPDDPAGKYDKLVTLIKTRKVVIDKKD